MAELEPFLCEWWKILDFGCIGRFQQIYVFCRIFIFRRHGHIFWPKLVLFFLWPTNYSYFMCVKWHQFACILGFARSESVAWVKSPPPGRNQLFQRPVWIGLRCFYKTWHNFNLITQLFLFTFAFILGLKAEKPGLTDPVDNKPKLLSGAINPEIKKDSFNALRKLQVWKLHIDGVLTIYFWWK